MVFYMCSLLDLIRMNGIKVPEEREEFANLGVMCIFIAPPFRAKPLLSNIAVTVSIHQIRPRFFHLCFFPLLFSLHLDCISSVLLQCYHWLKITFASCVFILCTIVISLTGYPSISKSIQFVLNSMFCLKCVYNRDYNNTKLALF